MLIEDNVFTVKTQIHSACKVIKNEKKAVVKLIAVSKRQTIINILAMADAGVNCFGENYVAELVDKKKALADMSKGEDFEWHFIGPIQRNKIKKLAEVADWVQSLSRITEAKKLNRHCADLGKIMPVLIQVNISQEPQKSGVDMAELDALIKTVNDLPCLALRGLMCIPAKGSADADFGKMCEIFTGYKTLLGSPLDGNEKHEGFDTLSMGMSGDYTVAIAYGSTMVRVGRALFGEWS